MSENAKRLLSLVMVAAMLLSFSPIRAQAQAAEPETQLQEQQAEASQELPEPIEDKETIESMPQLLADGTEATLLTLDTPLSIYVASYAETHRFSFTPEEDGMYVFASLGDYNAHGILRDAEDNVLAANDDYEDYNFQICYYLTAGQTYYLSTFVHDWTDITYQVQVRKSPVVGFSVAPIEIPAYSIGFYTTSWTEETGTSPEYFNYRWVDLIQYNVSMADGSNVTGNGAYIDFEGRTRTFICQDEQRYESQWTEGNTYNTTVEFMGFQVSVPVTITESPLLSITAEPLTFVENSNGNYNRDWIGGEETPEYFSYDWYNRIQVTVTMKDGRSFTGNAWGVHIDGTHYPFSRSNDQGYENQWTVGNTYHPTLSLMGQSVEVSVSIVPSPVASFALEPISIPAYTKGYYTTSWTENGESPEFFRYSWQSYIRSIVTLTDGTVVTGNGWGVTINGEYRSFDYGFDGQEYAAQWTAGNTYTITMSLLGKTADAFVTITDAPVVSVSIDPISIMEKEKGSMTEENGKEYFRYDWIEAISYTVTLQDGTVRTDSGAYVYIPDSDNPNSSTGYRFQITDSQSADTPWLPGNTYTATATLMGIETPVEITITETPVASISVDPLMLEEERNGHWSWYGNTRYYYYNWFNYITYTVTMKDGSTVKASGNGFYYQDTWFPLEYADQQDGQNPWLAGNTYTVPVAVCGAEATASITICKPVTQDGFTYLVQNDQVIITDCQLETNVLQIPDTIDGKPVVGITSLGWMLEYVTELHIPDSVTMISENLFSDCWYVPLEKLYVGSGISQLESWMLSQATQLKEIHVSDSNPYMTSVEGVLYDKELTTLLLYPVNKTDKHVIPDTVTNIDALFQFGRDSAPKANVEFGKNIKNYVMENGVIYNKAKTQVLLSTPAATGKYVLPETVTSIGYFAFSGSQFTEVTLNENITTLVYGTFDGCKSLEKVTLPETLFMLDERVFAGCTNLQSINIPASLGFSAGDAFLDCYKLQRIDITSLTDWVYTDFFEGTANPLNQGGQLYLNGQPINDLVVPDIEYIPYCTFYGGTFKTVTVPGTVYYLGGQTFYNANIGTLTFSEGIGSIGAEAFAYSTVKSVTLPNSLCNVSYGAFRGSSLESVELGSGITHIPECGFMGTKLTQVTIPEQVDSIGYAAFKNTPLSNIDFNSKELYISDEAFQNCPVEDLDLSNVISINDQSFEGSYETVLQLPDTVTQLSYRSFAYSPQLVCAVIPATMTTDGYWGELTLSTAFEGNTNLSHILYKGSQEQWAALTQGIPGWDESFTVHCNATGNEVTAEMDCTTIRMFCSICNEWETIYRYKTGHKLANGVCTVCGHSSQWDYIVDPETDTVTITGYSGSERKLTIPSYLEGKKVTKIGDNALNDANLTEVTVPNTVTRIGKYAFACNPDLYKARLGSSVEEIDEYAFQRCAWMNAIDLPASLTKIGYGAFESCHSLHQIRFGGTEEQWNAIGNHEEAGLWAPVEFEADVAINSLPDFTGDNQVSDADAIYLLRHTLFPDDFPLTGNGDINNDGTLSDADAIYLLRHTLFPDDFPLFP